MTTIENTEKTENKINIFDLYDKNSCDMRGKYGSNLWTWEEYFQKKSEFEAKWIKIVLVDMIWHPVQGALPISNEMFFNGDYPEGTVFALYCHSGWSSGYVQKQLQPQLPQYTIINMDDGLSAYQIWKMNH